MDQTRFLAGRISAVRIHQTFDHDERFVFGSECPLIGDPPLCSLFWYKNPQFPTFHQADYNLSPEALREPQ